VRIPGVIPGAGVQAALRAINHSLGSGMNVADVPQLQARGHCPELRRQPVITDLVNRTPAIELLESLLGRGKVSGVNDGQIAMRFPMRATLDGPPAEPHPHLDGMYTPLNGVPQGKLLNFTLLAGVFLSDVPERNCGNFTVWPGTHLSHARYFRARGPRSLLKGMPKVRLPEPHQITVRAGDLVLAHYLLAHSVAPHVGAHVRYAVFFRVYSTAHHEHPWRTMTDPWLDWPGLRNGAASYRRAR
jgi:hypothetical protein